MDTGELSMDVTDVDGGDGYQDKGFIVGGRLGQYNPDDDKPVEKSNKAKGNVERQLGSTQPKKLGQIPNEEQEEDQERSNDEEEDQEDAQDKNQQGKSKESETTVELKRLKNAVPALQRKLQEYENRFKDFNPETIEKQIHQKTAQEITDWFRNHPDEVISQVLKIRGEDPNQFYRDKFLKIAEFEQKSDVEKQAIMAEQSAQNELAAMRERLQQFEGKEKQAQEEQQKQERANFRTKTLQFVAKFCEDNGLPSNSPLKVVRVVESILRAAKDAKDDPSTAAFDENTIAKFYHDASWEEQLLDIQHIKWSQIKDRPDSDKLIEACKRIIKEKAKADGTAIIDRPTKKLFTSDNGGPSTWGNFINEHDLNKMKRKGNYL